MFLFAVCILLIDQFCKYFVRSKLALGESIPLIKNVFHLTLMHNSGAAFGLLQDQTHILTFLSILTVAIILIFYRRVARSGFIFQVAFGLIVGGASSNLADRLMFGHVIDFIDFRVWPVFNIADSALTVGVILLLWKINRNKSGT